MSKTFTLLTYNIDGLNPYEIRDRTSEILGIILSEDPDIVHLQEVVPETAPVLCSTFKMNGYQVCGANEKSAAMAYRDIGHYYTLTFVKIKAFTSVKTRRVEFSGDGRSLQGRNLLQTVVHFNGVDILSVNCHLESTGTAFKSAESFTRMAQLNQAMTCLCAHSGPAFIAGDLNIRDAEATKILSEQNSNSNTTSQCSIRDVAEVVEGKTKSNTWFMPIKNSAKMMNCRFDRIYANAKNGLTPVSLRIVGADPMFPATELRNSDSTGCSYLTPSDHRGIVVVFSVICCESTGAPSSAGGSSFQRQQSSESDVAASTIGRSSGSPLRSAGTNGSYSSSSNSTSSSSAVGSYHQSIARRPAVVVVDLCGDSPEEVPSRKRRKAAEEAREEAGGDEDRIERTEATVSTVTTTTPVVPSGVDRRQLFLDAINKRHREAANGE